MSPKILAGLLSNVKDSFYLIETGVIKSHHERNFLTNYQIETMLLSKLYGCVLVLGFRPRTEFRLAELAPKFAKLWESAETIEVAGTPQVIKGIALPARKEKLTIYRLENLVYIDLCPQLKKACFYNYVRSQENPSQALLTLLAGICKANQQNTVIVDRLEILTSLLGPSRTLDFIKHIRTTENLFPFFAHFDALLAPQTEQFPLKLQKLANAMI